MQQADFSTKVSPMVSPITKKVATPGMGCNVFISGGVWYLYFPEAKTMSTLKIGVEMKSRAQKVISVLALVGVGAGIKGMHRTTSTIASLHNQFYRDGTAINTCAKRRDPYAPSYQRYQPLNCHTELS